MSVHERAAKRRQDAPEWKKELVNELLKLMKYGLQIWQISPNTLLQIEGTNLYLWYLMSSLAMPGQDLC